MKQVTMLARDLKLAFREYLRSQLVPERHHAAEWRRFWRRLEKKTVVSAFASRGQHS